MAEKLLMLALSPTMEKAVIARWLKKKGDLIANGDVICEVETDKATMDYEAYVDGVLLKIVVEEGSEASIGDLIAIVGEEGEDISSLVPDDTIKHDKALAKSNHVIKQDESNTIIESSDESTVGDESTAEFIKSSPLARKLAKQNNLNLARIEGSGPAGRIVKADVLQAIKANSANLDAWSSPAAPLAVDQDDRIVPNNKVRTIIAKRLSESKFRSPHYYLKVAVDTGPLMTARNRLNEKVDQKVSVHAFLIKLIAEALKKHPKVNAGWNNDSIIMFGRIDIGLAVAQEDGLITPVIRDANKKGIVQINQELSDLIEKAKTGRLQPEEYSGATFTISSLGSYGIDEFTAIINPPGSAILAVGAIKKETVVTDDDKVTIRSAMRLTLSCDHRTIDGAIGAAFLAHVKAIIESPIQALY